MPQRHTFIVEEIVPTGTASRSEVIVIRGAFVTCPAYYTRSAFALAAVDLTGGTSVARQVAVAGRRR